MRKYVLSLLLLCLHGLARGQTEGYSSYYWFDLQDGKPIISPLVQGTFDIDVSALDDGIHAFHYLVVKKDSIVSSPTVNYFLKATSNATLDQLTCLCFVDGNLVHKELLPAEGGTIHWNLDVGNITDGLHLLQIEVLSANGALSGSRHNYFVKMPKADATMKGYYWFDTDTEVHEVAVTNGTFEVDASSLSDGFHRFHYQALHSNGTTSLPTANFFLKTAQVSEGDMLNCICSVDGQLRHIEKLSLQGGVIHWDLDMHDLTDGLHRIQLQAVTSSGAMCSSYTSYFMRITTAEELGEMRCLYAVDDDAFNTDASVMGSNGNYHFDLDLSELSDGLHHISYMLYNDRGTSTKIQTRFFLKVPLGGNAIGQYQYWLNDDDINEAKTVTLSQKVNPLQLMSLLPVESRPFRSSLFHFDISSGQPKVYAKNTIHLRFYDAALRFTDAVKDYADYSISQDVSIIKDLESGISETTTWPEENEIKWYQVTAERGDSLSFKTDIAATLQLFSPSGKEVYSASGSEVVKWGGCHAEENGTYYLALHDVTATQGENISIDYEHIDRYAVLRQDVAVVGNSGFSTITFEGNGFDELTSVELVLGNNTITSVEIGHESNATTSVKFDFTDATLGLHKAVFHFEGGELIMENCVTVEEPKDIEFFTTVSYNSMFMKWDTNKFVFKINNLGNMTAYNVPINIFVYTENHDYLTYTKVHGFDLLAYYKDILGNKFTDSLAIAINHEMAVYGDKQFFVKAMDNDFISNNPCVHWTSICPDLHAGINELTVEVKLDETHRMVYVYLVVPEEWDNNVENVNPSRSDNAWDDECLEARLIKLRPCQHAYQVYILSERQDMSLLRDNDCIKKSEYCKNRPKTGGSALSIVPGDPNDIFGYIAESGSRAIKNGQNEVYYTIEFENNPEIATAPAHEIFVTDTLDATKFDLSTFTPTQVIIGEKSAELTGDKNFVTTIDMRPEINAIAQVEGTFDEQKGIAKWHISSLDPMTMEPTDDVMQGVLPVNVNGSGIGELMFDINLKPDLAHGTEIDNRAAIVFDKNEVIMTPTWTNIIDRIVPESHVTDVRMLNDSTASVSIEASDELSGPWRYDVYVQYGEHSNWFLGAKDVPIDKEASVKVYEGINHGFYVVVTDSAGNAEQKQAEREFTLDIFGSQKETNTKIQLTQGWNWMSHNQDAPLHVEAVKPKAQQIVSQTAGLYKDSQQNWTGYLEELLPTEMYKVQMIESGELQLSGLLFNAAFRSVPLRQGWNWIGYPVAHAMSIGEALSKLNAEEGDAILSQDGIAIFSDGHWTGTLSTMYPGVGYMYRSVSDKNLFLNASAQYSSRKITNAKTEQETTWNTNKRSYPDVMGFIADLYQNESTVNYNDFVVGAFCNEECRGVAQVSDGHLMMNVYGENGDVITFRVLHLESGEELMVAEQEIMYTDVLGSINQPYELHIGKNTGIVTKDSSQKAHKLDIYDLQGRKIDNTQIKKGFYLQIDSDRKNARKIVKK